MNIWLLSPYHTGSHQSWALGYQRYSRHDVRLLTMAGRFWKWRMQGGAMELTSQARQLLAEGDRPDAILATDMVNLSAWLGLMRRDLPTAPPIVLYMHENQLTYPWRPGEKPDFTYAMINWLSQLSADVVLFNSEYHRHSWFDALPRLLKHFPDYNHLYLIEAAQARSSCLPVGIDCSRIGGRVRGGMAVDHEKPPLILWNQRWEYDKQPEAFFRLLYRLQEADIPFRVAVAGENFRNVPAEFEEAHSRLGSVITHWGFAADHESYRALLHRANLVISTALHEFFGISVLEAIAAGAFPLLPRRLSYPELIPDHLHPACLYDDDDDLFAKASLHLTTTRPAPPSLQAYIREQFDWPSVAAAYDDLFTMAGELPDPY